MVVTVIKSSYSIKQILIGKETEQLRKWVNEINSNPLIEEEYTIEEKHSDKSVYDLAKFLGIEQ